MNASEIADALRDFIKRRFNIAADDGDFDDDVHLFDFGYVDSFGAVDLTAFVEEHCAIKVSPSDMVVFPLNSIRQISDFAAKRANGEL